MCFKVGEPSAWCLWNLVDKHKDSTYFIPAGTESWVKGQTENVVYTEDTYSEKDATWNPDWGAWGIAFADHDTSTLTLSQKYYAYGQFTKYINPGDTILAISDSNIAMAAYNKETGDIKIVAVNSTDTDQEYLFDLSGFDVVGTDVQMIRTIGVSSAGVYIDNKIMVASLFLKVSDEDFEKRVKTMYIDIAKEIGDVPIEVANDGDVTALAGAMDLNDTNVLGVAMGTSEAVGYVDSDGNITGWLNELAFVPVDFNKESMVDEWSGDYGCGVKYFSQDSVIKLAPAAGIELDESLSPAEKLKVVQKLMEEGDERATKIYDTIGVYFGNTIAYYSMFYDIKHVIIMGRVTSGDGGSIILKRANEVLEQEYPQLAEKIQLHIPDEKSRRVGQSVAAASLPLCN